MHISEITIYPIKGCRGQMLEQATVTPMGLQGDREFTVLAAGKSANQKLMPDLRQLQAIWQDEVLLLAYPGMPDLAFVPGAGEQETALPIFGQPVAVLDLGAAVASWLSQALQAEVRLVRAKAAIAWHIPLPEFERVIGQPQTKFVDTSPVLLTSQASLDDLNQRLATPVPMNRFRANLVVAGLPAYAEDQVGRFDFPGLTLEKVAPCERCTVTTIDQALGTMAKEPLLTLSGYRRRTPDYAGGIVFGSYLSASVGGRVAVGDLFKTASP
jgi:uncharacterized protein YcbX